MIFSLEIIVPVPPQRSVLYSFNYWPDFLCGVVGPPPTPPGTVISREKITIKRGFVIFLAHFLCGLRYGESVFGVTNDQGLEVWTPYVTFNIAGQKIRRCKKKKFY